jgi:serine/threonine protein kinase
VVQFSLMPMEEPEVGMLVTPSVRLLRRLGSGSMGSVWLADHKALDTQVVVKFMSPAVSQHPDLVARFSREAAAASRVKSPHVVHMLDHGVTEGGLPYIIMEHLEGRDLQKRLHDGARLPPREVAIMIAQLSKALSRAHERGVLHRDLKPSNVFLCDNGDGDIFVKLLDFGVARSPHRAKDLADPADTLDATQAGTLLGTPYFMSPEQLAGGDLDARSDLWALGVLTFRMLTGQRPFRGDSVPSLTLAVCVAPMPVPTEFEPSLPKAIDAWFFHACARNRDERFGTARELAEALAIALDVRDAMPSASASGSLPSFDGSPILSSALPDVTPDQASAPGLGNSAYNYESLATTDPNVVEALGRKRRRRTLAVAITLGTTLIIGIGVFFATRHETVHTAAATAAIAPTSPGPASSKPDAALPTVSAPSITAPSASQTPSASVATTKPKPVVSAGKSIPKGPAIGPAPTSDDPFGESRH